MPRHLRNRRTGGVVYSTNSLPLIDRCRVDGFPVTSASRLAIDLAHDVSEQALENLVDSAVRQGWSSPAFVAQRLRELRGRGRSGVRLLERVLLDSGGHTMLERRFLVLVRLAGIERPRVQVVHSADGQFIARVDFYFDALGVVVEVMGRRWHDTPARFERDTQRHPELAALGRILLPFTFRQVFERPEWVIDQLRRTLAAAA